MVHTTTVNDAPNKETTWRRHEVGSLNGHITSPSTQADPSPSVETLRKLSDEEIREIASDLRHTQSPWANSPRLYAILRQIDKLDDIHLFSTSGVTDLWLPLTKTTFPKGLASETRALFLAVQPAVLSASLDLEKGERGLHRHYFSDQDIPFSAEGSLGRGSYGEVDRVKSTLTGIEYARKRIPRKFPGHHGEHRSRQVMDKFENEIKAIKLLNHQHIVKLVGSYTDPSSVALIMSPVADVDLRTFLDNFQPSETSKKLLRGFFGCLTTGLAYMHSKAVRHKDVKPANILIKGDQILYTDLGLAFCWDDVGHSTTEESFPAITRKYSPPEVFSGEKRNTSADIWALGCVFIEMMTVLYRSPLNKLTQHLELYGTKSTIYGMNHDGSILWIDTLKSSANTERDRIMLELVKSMINRTPWKRPNAQAAHDRITFIDAMADGTTFISGCCKPERQPSLGQSASKTVMVPSILLSRTATSDGSEHLTNESSESRISSLNGSESPGLSAVGTTQELTVFTPPPSSPSSVGLEDPVTPAEHDSKSKRTRPDRSKLVLSASLNTALIQKDIEKARGLVKAGVDLNYQDFEGITPLTRAIMISSIEMMTLFLENGADIHLQNQINETCFHHAADKADLPIVQKLLELGADPNLPGNEGRTPMYYAMSNKVCDRRQLLRLLVERGGDAKMTTKVGTLLHRAAACGSDDLVEDLIAFGINIDHASEAYNCTALYLAAYNGHVPFLEKLLAFGANKEIPRMCGSSPLVGASRFGKEEAVRKLLEQGADVNARDKSGCTAFYVAAQNGHMHAAEALLGSGRIDMNEQLDKCGCTPLHGAVLNKKDEMMKFLIEHGASVDVKTNFGHTPLHQAVESKSTSSVKLLLEYGADPLAVTKKGASAIDIAVKEGLVNILHLLADAAEEEEQQSISSLSTSTG